MNFVEYIYRSEVKVKGLRNADNLFGSAFELFYYLLNKSYENKKNLIQSYTCFAYSTNMLVMYHNIFHINLIFH